MKVKRKSDISRYRLGFLKSRWSPKLRGSECCNKKLDHEFWTVMANRLVNLLIDFSQVHENRPKSASLPISCRSPDVVPEAETVGWKLNLFYEEHQTGFRFSTRIHFFSNWVKAGGSDTVVTLVHFLSLSFRCRPTLLKL